ncbi:peptidyl-prolyl cis-trans isomerase NIMA-interacting 1 [Pelomyxa schiedti]|nr:peptidyl-prolyl cis-trans isomerase NIMA-interacting 1 [Pelomyxa schiedti]
MADTKATTTSSSRVGAHDKAAATLVGERFSVPDWATPRPVPASFQVKKDASIITQVDLGSISHLVVGRHPMAASFVVTHPTVSRSHAAIVNDEMDSYVADLKSINGTFVNGVPILPLQFTQLHHEDVVTFGQSSRLYVFTVGPTSAPKDPLKVPDPEAASHSPVSAASSPAKPPPVSSTSSTTVPGVATPKKPTMSSAVSTTPTVKQPVKPSSITPASVDSPERPQKSPAAQVNRVPPPRQSPLPTKPPGSHRQPEIPPPKEVPQKRPPPPTHQHQPSDSKKPKDEPKVRCKHILVKHKDSSRPSSWREAAITRTKDEALKKIIDIREQIATGTAQFDHLAETESDCSSAKRKGDLGRFGKGVMKKAFEDSAFALPIGGLSQPVFTDSGVHIIMRIE